MYKTPPYYPILDHFDAAMSLTTEDMDNLVEWGFTAVRLFAAWPGVYPARGQVRAPFVYYAKYGY